MRILGFGGNQLAAGGYEVANSLRFDDGSSDYLDRTPASASNRKTWTFSCWVKRGNLTGAQQHIIQMFPAGTGYTRVFFENDESLSCDGTDSSAGNAFELTTNRLFRDVSAWYHIVVALDTTQGTASNRLKIYVNGIQETSFETETYPAENIDYQINNNEQHNIGRYNGGSEYFDGYMAEVVLIDGQQLDPTSFGEFDEDTGIWKPINVSGLTFGTNGFYLDFENSGSLGADVSGNGNNFTVNNLTSVDQSTDTCTNNFATLNPLTNEDTDITLSQGNLDYANSGTGDETVFASIGVSSGKWYFETKWTDTSNYMDIGVGSANEGDIGSPRADAEGTGYYMIQLRTASPGTRPFDNGSAGSGLGNSALNDINMFAIDMDNNKFFAGKNGTWYSSGDPASGSNPLITMDDGFTTLIPIVCGKSNSAVSVNFGSPSYTISSGNSDGNGYGNFEYSVPSGYYALNTKNLAEFG